MDYLLKITYFFRTWSSSRKYPSPPPTEGNRNSEGMRGVQKCASSEGVRVPSAWGPYVKLVSYKKLTPALLSKLSAILLFYLLKIG